MSPPEFSAMQQTIDDTVTEWPGVRAKLVFGHRGWVHNGKMFGFIAEEGVAVKAFAGAETDEIYSRAGVVPFAYNSMPMRAWPVLPLRSDADLEVALTSLQNAYEHAVAT